MSPVELFSLCPTFNSYVIGVLFLFLVTFISCLLSMFVPMHELSYKYCRIFLFPVCRQCIYTELVLQIKINRTSHDTKSRPSMFYIRKARTLRMNKVILTSKREMLCNFYLQAFVNSIQLSVGNMVHLAFSLFFKTWTENLYVQWSI